MDEDEDGGHRAGEGRNVAEFEEGFVVLFLIFFTPFFFLILFFANSVTLGEGGEFYDVFVVVVFLCHVFILTTEARRSRSFCFLW